METEERVVSGNVSVYPSLILGERYIIEVARHFDCETGEWQDWRVFWRGGELTPENVQTYVEAMLKAADIAERKNADIE